MGKPIPQHVDVKTLSLREIVHDRLKEERRSMYCTLPPFPTKFDASARGWPSHRKGELKNTSHHPSLAVGYHGVAPNEWNSYTSTKYSRHDRWSAVETELFYVALGQFGTDFDLITRSLPSRNRKQIKNKYTK